MVGLVTILLAGNVVIAYFQLPSIFLPVYKNQKRSFEDNRRRNIEAILRILEIIEGKNDSFLTTKTTIVDESS